MTVGVGVSDIQRKYAKMCVCVCVCGERLRGFSASMVDSLACGMFCDSEAPFCEGCAGRADTMHQY